MVWLTVLLGLSVNLFALVLLTHICFPEARTQTSKFFKLSYYNPDTGNYGLGPNDAWMVVFWVVVFTGLRAVVMDYALLPFSKMAGVKKERDQARFCEQAWLLVYYSVFWTLGMVGRLPFYTMRTALLTISVHLGHLRLLA
jgi:acyl-CoA-dependent ceramide synthase